jgi:hypothetical protein
MIHCFTFESQHKTALRCVIDVRTIQCRVRRKLLFLFRLLFLRKAIKSSNEDLTKHARTDSSVEESIPDWYTLRKLARRKGLGRYSFSADYELATSLVPFSFAWLIVLTYVNQFDLFLWSSVSVIVSSHSRYKLRPWHKQRKSIQILMSTWQQHALANTATNHATQLAASSITSIGIKSVEKADGLGEINHTPALSGDFGT